MRIPRVQLTVRRTMALVLAFGAFWHLALTAWRVYPATGPHLHSWIVITDGIAQPCFNPEARSPFFSRYWRCLLGLPWKGQVICNTGAGQLEMCELESPDMNPDRSYPPPVLTRSQADLFHGFRSRMIPDELGSRTSRLSSATGRSPP